MDGDDEEGVEDLKFQGLLINLNNQSENKLELFRTSDNNTGVNLGLKSNKLGCLTAQLFCDQRDGKLKVGWYWSQIQLFRSLQSTTHCFLILMDSVIIEKK